MKSNRKTKIIIFITIGILFAFLPIFINNPRFIARDRDITSNYRDEFDHDNLKISAVSGSIYIDDTNPSSNWSVAKDAGICTGNGTYSEPYVIEDLVIDGGGSGSGIFIENSNVYFKIENCTVYNSGTHLTHAGVRFLNTNNSQLIDNNCSYNNKGIILKYCNNNTISGNTVTYNNNDGIDLEFSDNNTISGNTINNNWDGIDLEFSDNNTISGNTANYNVVGIKFEYSGNNTVSGNLMNKCGLQLYRCSFEELRSHDIDTTNLVNGKPLYYYTNEENLGSTDFANAGQVILVNCNDSLISNLNVSYSTFGISLYYCNNNDISGNTANNNYIGIQLQCCDDNAVSGNTANNNYMGIYLHDCDDNAVSGNTANYTSHWGICLRDSDNNTISGNTVNYNRVSGIYLRDSDNNTISGNTVNYNRVSGIDLLSSDYSTILENIANNNGDYGICLLSSWFNNITGNIASANNGSGIGLLGSWSNNIMGNIASANNISGIYLSSSDNNIVSGNTLLGNRECIIEENCEGNVFENNDCGNGDRVISGYDLFFLLGILSVVAILISKKKKKS